MVERNPSGTALLVFALLIALCFATLYLVCEVETKTPDWIWLIYFGSVAIQCGYAAAFCGIKWSVVGITIVTAIPAIGAFTFCPTPLFVVNMMFTIFAALFGCGMGIVANQRRSEVESVSEPNMRTSCVLRMGRSIKRHEGFLPAIGNSGGH